MGRFSRQKGKRGERLCARELSEQLQVPIRRGIQFAGGTDSPDCLIEVPTTLHIEAKLVEKLNIYLAMAQAVGDASTDKIPLVWQKRSRESSLITIRTEDLAAFVLEAARLIALDVADDPKTS